MNLNLSGIVGALASHTVTVQRPAASTFSTAGIANAQTFTSFDARASVQPIKGRDLARLPEGSNPSGYVTIHCAEELKLRDRVTVPGRGVFEVEHLDLWNDHGSFSKSLARQLNVNEPRP